MDAKKVKVPVREQEPAVRATNFDEVCLGYNKEEAMAEANRCLACKTKMCGWMSSRNRHTRVYNKN